jgi:hypothetical protein
MDKQEPCLICKSIADGDIKISYDNQSKINDNKDALTYCFNCGLRIAR